MSGIITKVDKSICDRVMNFIFDSKFQLQALTGKMDEDLQIYMPQYFQEVLSIYLQSIHTIPSTPDTGLKSLYGIEVLDNYQNSIVMSFKNIQLYKNIEPKVMFLP